MFRTIILDCACWKQLNAGTIDGIARIHLAARRHGVGLRLQNVNGSLLALIDFCGLVEVLRVESGRQTK